MDSSEALLQRANEITRKFLAGQYISDDDYKFSVMLNLAAMTQLLWELSPEERSTAEKAVMNSEVFSGLESLRGSGRWRKRLLRLVVPIAFLAGLGMGYLIP